MQLPDFTARAKTVVAQQRHMRAEGYDLDEVRWIVIEAMQEAWRAGYAKGHAVGLRFARKDMRKIERNPMPNPTIYLVSVVDYDYDDFKGAFASYAGALAAWNKAREELIQRERNCMRYTTEDWPEGVGKSERIAEEEARIKSLSDTNPATCCPDGMRPEIEPVELQP